MLAKIHRALEGWPRLSAKDRSLEISMWTKKPRASQWRAFRMLLGAGIHVMPRLRARCKDIHHWVIDRWIVQAARLQTQNIWQSLKFHGQLAAAGWAKTTFNCLAGVANDFVVTWFAANLDRGFWYCHNRSVGAASRLLANPTVTIQHHHGIHVTLVMDGTAGASARYFLYHGLSSFYKRLTSISLEHKRQRRGGRRGLA
jgi:hypothetical protein